MLSFEDSKNCPNPVKIVLNPHTYHYSCGRLTTFALFGWSKVWSGLPSNLATNSN